MEDTLGALGLVLNCVTLWNTVYLDRALTQLRAAGYPALDADVARLSAYLRRHINIHGHYTVALPDLVVAIASCAIPTSTIPATRRSRPTHSYSGRDGPAWGRPVWTPGAPSCWGLCLRQPVLDHAQESSVS